jgi:peptidoglycan/LPS O-acetylase OafA/YrhL
MSQSILMQNSTTANTKYDFIDSLRFISMICIVMEHSALLLGKTYTHFSDQAIQICSLFIFKFGTIIFFLLSGFLIGDKFNTYSSKEYFARRWGNTFKPWLFWVIVAVGLNYLNFVIVYLKFGMNDILLDPWKTFYTQLYNIVFLTSFWFIINFLICIAILLTFRRYLDKLLFGAILAVCSLFYSVNLYFNWLPTGHTTAIFGFVFYLWLGYQINRNFSTFKNWVERMPIWFLTVAMLFSFAINCAESLLMIHIKLYPEAFNTLKITNIVYSLVAFVTLFKLSKYINVDIFKPRMVTFGIYLIHHMLIFHVLPEFFRPLGFRDEDYRPMWQMLSLTLLRFVIAYSMSYLMALWIARGSKKVSWLVGQ